VKVRVTAAAESDLERIGDFIARDNPERALSFIVELRDKCFDLAANPLAFASVPRYERFGIRRRIHGNYLIFYCADESGVVILRVLHGAMDYVGALFDT
jgi:plasmid stabilization system protein ParE